MRARLGDALIKRSQVRLISIINCEKKGPMTSSLHRLFTLFVAVRIAIARPSRPVVLLVCRLELAGELILKNKTGPDAWRISPKGTVPVFTAFWMVFTRCVEEKPEIMVWAPAADPQGLFPGCNGFAIGPNAR